MSGVRERMLPVVARLRSIADTKMGLRRYRVFIRREQYSDGRGGLGATISRIDVELTEKPRVLAAGAQHIATSGGRVRAGDFLLDRITPKNDAGTVGIAPGAIDIEPTPGVREKVVIVLVGPGMPEYVAGPPASGGGEFTVVDADETGNFGFRYAIRPRTGHR